MMSAPTRRRFQITIGTRQHYLPYLLFSHSLKAALLSSASRTKLDAINRAFNERIYSGDHAASFEDRYEDADQHEYPARLLVEDIWGAEGYGRALEVGAGSGYFTRLIAPKATSVLAIELVADMQRVLRDRCDAEGLRNVEVIGTSVLDLGQHVAASSLDSVLILHSLHHLSRRAEVLREVARVLRPGGRLLMVEPHHNARRVASLVRTYVRTYRPRKFWADDENWATHDFVTRAELSSLCRGAGFGQIDISSFWFPYSRRMLPDPRRRFRLEGLLGRIPILRHVAGVLAVSACRRSREGGRPLER